MGDERAETYLRLLAEAELRRVGEQVRRVDAMAGIEARSREGMSLFGATERAQWKVVRTARSSSRRACSTRNASTALRAF